MAGFACRQDNIAGPQSLSQQIHWNQTQGPFGGNVRCVTVANDGLVLVGTLLHDGVYVSSDQGASWSNIGPKGSGINVLQVDANDRIFVAVQTVEGGLFRSNDLGKTWLPLAAPCNYMAFDDSGKVYATSYDGLGTSTDNGNTWTFYPISSASKISILPDHQLYLCSIDGLLRSVDGGQTWTNLFPGEIEDFATAGGDTLFVVDNLLIYRSFDRGEHWTTLTGVPQYWQYIAIAVSRNGHVFFAANTETTSLEVVGHIYHSTDAGVTWTDIFPGAPAIWSFAITPEGRLIAGTSDGVWMSPDEDGQWTQIGIPTGTTMALAEAPNGTLVASTANGICRSTDGGQEWTMTHPIRATDYSRSITVHPNGAIFATTPDSGTIRSTDNGLTWQSVHQLLSYRAPILASTSSGSVFIVGWNPGIILRSDDVGQSWQPKTTGLPSSNPSSLLVSQLGPLYVSLFEGLFRSTNNGDSWTRISTLDSLSDSRLVESPAGGLFLITYANWHDEEPVIYRSDDQGSHWYDIKSTFPNYITSMLIDFNERFIVGSSTGVYTSTDGIHWQQNNDGLFDVVALSLCQTRGGVFFCGTSGGIFYSH